jgi:cysteine desulfurase
MGMAKAVELCNVSDEKIQERVCIRNYFINALMGLGCKVNGAIINNSESNNLSRLPNNINVTFPQRITGEALIYMLDTVGIMISSGSACNSHTNKPSQVLITIGLTDNEIMRTVRLTFSDDLTEKDIDKVICEIKKILKLFSYDERKI